MSDWYHTSSTMTKRESACKLHHSFSKGTKCKFVTGPWHRFSVFFVSHQRISHRAVRTSLEIGSNCFSMGPAFLRNPTATCDFPGWSGPLIPPPPPSDDPPMKRINEIVTGDDYEPEHKEWIGENDERPQIARRTLNHKTQHVCTMFDCQGIVARFPVSEDWSVTWVFYRASVLSAIVEHGIQCASN